MINDYRYSSGKFTVPFFQFDLTGSDVYDFLDHQSTFDVKKLGNDQFHLATFLDPQGKVDVYGWLLRHRSHFSYLVPPALADAARARLNKFLVSEDVEIAEGGITDWTFVTGGTGGVVFDEPATLTMEPVTGVPEISSDDVDLWRGLTGWPSFDGSDFRSELINNTRLFELALTKNKGCYPGQETVSKIDTHRGAAYSPVLIETAGPIVPGPLSVSGNRIGDAKKTLPWQGKYYVAANLLRDFRVEGMSISFEAGGKAFQGVVHYYPLLRGDALSKARELYDSALEEFRFDRLESAEAKLKMAISFDPKFSDAFEALGVMLGRQDRYPEAIGLMEKLIEVDPDSAMAHTNLSLFLMKVGKIEEAENHKSLATLKSFKRFGEEARQKEAAAENARREAEEWSRREKMFLEVLDIDPEDTLANYGLGSLSVERGEWERALGFLEKVIAADPKYSVAYLALGKTYKGLGQKDKARSTFREGIKVAAAKGDFMPANQMQAELDRL